VHLRFIHVCLRQMVWTISIIGALYREVSQMEKDDRPRPARVKIIGMLLLLAAYSCGSPQDKTREIDELMNLYYQYGQFNGAVLVAQHGDVIYEKGFGYANMEWSIPNTPDTRFRIASLTKQFTSMLVMQLVEEGRIDLNDRLTEYLPEYRQDTGSEVTIHHLLAHTSGIPNYTNIPGFWSDSTRNYRSLDYMLREYCSGDLRFEPGTEFEYSNSGYLILGLIIEKVTGTRLENVLHEKILKPLGMNDTGIDHHEMVLSRRASGYRQQIDGYTNAPYDCMQNFYGNGNMYSTVQDLYLWDQALYSDRLLSREYLELLFTPYLNDYAYGWGVQRLQVGGSGDSSLTVYHSGGMAGFNTHIFRVVDEHHLIVLLNNFSGDHRISAITRGIRNILYDLPYELPKNSIAKVLLKTIEERGISSAVTHYHRARSESPDSYDFGESELNSLGYYLLGKKRFEEAIAIFKLNVSVYPDASNTYDSLGEAYMLNGDRELAIENYEKSLVLDPGNANARNILKQLDSM
jgi:CubicO group peptidase (beta-lactamase class C family)